MPCPYRRAISRPAKPGPAGRTGSQRRACPARLDQRTASLEHGDLRGAAPELGEDLGVMLALAGRQLTLVCGHLVREVPRAARDLDLATRPVRYRPDPIPLAGPLAGGELLD